jgi:DHA2 family multidrug resistance protein
MLSGRLVSRIDPRYLVGTGLILLCASFQIISGWTPDVSQHDIIVTIILQGVGLGMVFTPLQVLAFATLPPALRTDGASLFSLLRNIGAAIGVSVTTTVLARNTQILHAIIGEAVTPFNRALGVIDAYNPATQRGAALLDKVVNQQAQVIAYANDYVLLICTTLPAILLLLLMRRPRSSAVPETEPVE